MRVDWLLVVVLLTIAAFIGWIIFVRIYVF